MSGSQPVRAWWRRRAVVLSAAGAGAAAVIAAALFSTGVLGSPSYPHVWCGPVLATLHNGNQTPLGEVGALKSLASHDHAPVSALARVLLLYDEDAALTGEASVSSFAGDASRTQLDIAFVTAELETVNQACRQPPGAYQQDMI